MMKIVWLLLALAACSEKGAVTIKNSHPTSGEKIVAFGDSITRGLGAPADKSYPAFLSRITGFPTVNQGTDSDTTRTALARLKKDVLELQPAMVIMSLGINDAHDQIPPEETLASLRSIFQQIQALGALVTYVSVEPESMRKKHIEERQKLCEQMGVIYIPNAVEYADAKLLFDSSHPNEFGYKLMADKIFPLIKRHFP